MSSAAFQYDPRAEDKTAVSTADLNFLIRKLDYLLGRAKYYNEYPAVLSQYEEQLTELLTCAKQLKEFGE